MSRILIACEESGVVREAFRALGHEAWSCDLLPSALPGPHIQGNVLGVLGAGWDLMLAFPPCTRLCNSGARWWSTHQPEQRAALAFVRHLLAAPIPRIALENPVGIVSTLVRKPDQIIQPWMFGDPYVKTTCLWLKGLPILQPTCLSTGREQQCWRMGPRKNRARDRARTYPGVAEAFASQWGAPLC